MGQKQRPNPLTVVGEPSASPALLASLRGRSGMSQGRGRPRGEPSASPALTSRRGRPRGERGAILLIVLIVVLTISLIGASLMALFFNVMTSSQVELDRARALYLAEAGIAKAVNILKNEASATPENDSKQMIPPTRLGTGTFEVYNDFSQSTLISVGNSNGVKRRIQMKYKAY